MIYRSDKTLRQLKNEESIELMCHSFRAIDGTHNILLITHTAFSGHIINNFIRDNSIADFSLSNEIETVIDYKNKK